MPKFRHAAVTAVLLTLVTVPALAAKTGYYRWVDDEGKPQFTQKPPVDKPYQYVEVSTGHSQAVGGTAPNADGESGEETPKGTEDMDVQTAAAKDPALCAQARQNLSTLGAGLIRLKQPDGSYKVLSEEEKEAQRKRAQEVADFHCE